MKDVIAKIIADLVVYAVGGAILMWGWNVVAAGTFGAHPFAYWPAVVAFTTTDILLTALAKSARGE